jgi:hypothetical protein
VELRLEDRVSGQDFKIVYTSDFSRPKLSRRFMEPDVLIIQSTGS